MLRHRSVVIGGEIEIIHGTGQIEIGIGVEALHESGALMPQVGLDLKVGIERKRRIVAVLKTAAELAVQCGVRQIGNVRAHARDREPAPRIGALGEIPPAAPFRIRHHRLTADLMEGDVLGRMSRRGSDRQRRKNALGIARRPLQHLHAAHGAAGYREKRVDAEMIEQHRLRANHVAHGDDGKIEAPRHAGRRVGPQQRATFIYADLTGSAANPKVQRIASGGINLDIVVQAPPGCRGYHVGQSVRVGRWRDAHLVHGDVSRRLKLPGDAIKKVCLMHRHLHVGLARSSQDAGSAEQAVIGISVDS